MDLDLRRRTFSKQMGHGGKVADENGHDELGRVHLSELALSHQPHRADDREIQHECAHERHGHENLPFQLDYSVGCVLV